MSFVIHDVEQGSPEWFRLRLGVPTASNFHLILAEGRKKGSPSVTRRRYLMQLAGELQTGQPMESFNNPHLERGREMESQAMSFYEMMEECEVRRVGFIEQRLNGRPVGCSPDAFRGDHILLEIKTAQPHILGELIVGNGEFPPEHVAQVQGGLWLCERDIAHLIVFWPGMPPFIKIAQRDEFFIRNLQGEVDRFNDELMTVMEQYRRYGTALAA